MKVLLGTDWSSLQCYFGLYFPDVDVYARQSMEIKILIQNYSLDIQILEKLL